jgi:DNA methylase
MQSDAAVAAAIKDLDRLPHRSAPFSARNWGGHLHSLCSYPSKIKPALAYFLVRNFTVPGDIVLDPFSGSGTIPLEACLNGRRGIGSDLSPLAWVLTSGKIAFPRAEDVEECLRLVEEAIKASEQLVEEPPAEVAAFYHAETLREILTSRAVIANGLEQSRVPSAWALVAAAVLHLLHGNRPYALSRRSHNLIPIPPRGPTEYRDLMPRLRRKLAALMIPPPGIMKGHALLADARAVPLADSSVDVILTSPPFLGTTDFIRQNRVRLWWAGWDYLRQAQEKASGRFLEYQGSSDPYRWVLPEMRRLLRAGGLSVLHVGTVRKRDMAAEIARVAVASGFAVEGRVDESVVGLESHGRTDRGATRSHTVLVLRAT